jgi:MSHA biogenesis protein MshL
MTRNSNSPSPLMPLASWLRLLALVGATLLVGCADRFQLRSGSSPVEQLNADMRNARASAQAKADSKAAEAASAAASAASAAASAASAAAANPEAPPRAAPPAPPPDPRFDLVVNGAAARDVFLSMVSETRYSMLMHPGVSGTISVTLRGVTISDALESIRDVYGYDYKIEGRRITVFPPTMQTRIFSINYLNTKRQGRSDMRVSGGSAPQNNNNGQNGYGQSNNNGQSNSNGNNGNNGNSSSNSNGQAPDSSQISTTSTTDFWTETSEALRSMVGNAGGRAVILSPQAGTVAVRAMPDELRQVEAFLRASRLSIERQVMLEAKIIEVELRDGFQSGIDWSVLKSNVAIGQTSGYAGNPLLGNTAGLPTLPSAERLASLGIDGLGVPVGAAGTAGVAISSNGFQAVMGFLESHGDLQILSSPRVATLNNQKAVLKVGRDEYFVTNVSGGTLNTGSTSNNNNNDLTTMPSLTLTPFFSGIALDVTPQIDDADTITLHIHPSVTLVTERTKTIDLGKIGTYKLPLASSNVNETDTVVRVLDGNIVAIGGLMEVEGTRQNSGLPGSSANSITGTLFGNNAKAGRKKELVVLIKPTIIRTAEDWAEITRRNAANLDDLNSATRRVIHVDGATPPAAR